MATPNLIYELAPIPKWYIADLSGNPLGGGYMQTFSSTNHSAVKYVYTDATGTTPFPTTFINGIPSIVFDSNGSQGPFYWEVETNTAASDYPDLYFIVVYDINGVFQWSVDKYGPPFAGSGPSPETNNGLINLIVNSTMIENIGQTALPSNVTFLKIATGAHARLASTPSNFGPDIVFIKNNTSAIDQLQFMNFVLGSTNLSPDATPPQYLNYSCGGAGTSESLKCIQFPICQDVQNLNGSLITISFWARCNSGNQLIFPSIVQFFGDGVAPGPIPTATLVSSLPTTTLAIGLWTQITQNFTVPVSTGDTRGACGNDGIFLRINYPLNNTTNMDFTKVNLYLGNVIPTDQFTPYDVTDSIVHSPRTGDASMGWSVGPRFGWVHANDGTIGNAVSGATARRNIDTFPLFNLIWNNFNDFWTTISGGGRGASAIADFSANKNLSLPKTLGRVLAGQNPLLTSTVFTVTISALTFTTVHATSDVVLNFASHTFTIGQPVQLSTTGALPTGLSVLTTYYISTTGLTATTVQLATNLQNAIAGASVEYPSVSFSDDGSGTQTFTNTSNVLTLSSSQTPVLTAGTPVQLTNSGGALPSGLFDQTVYFVSSTGITSTTVMLSDNLTDALAGYFIGFQDNGSGTNTLLNSVGNYNGASYTTDVAQHEHTVEPYYGNSVGGFIFGSGTDAAINNPGGQVTGTTGVSEVSIIQPTNYVSIFIKL